MTAIKRVLFLCSRNCFRSPTAEQVFSSWENLECDSAGLAPDAEVILSAEQVDWATHIFVMEKRHRSTLSRRFRKYLGGKRVVCLDIADDYGLMDPALIRLLKAKAGPLLR